ncbi:hypothetical protein A2585_03200 [Candidatus Nomurabacteria bacterium RIFOXYD1_FULL_39_12]|nr:MAG: hypothetical protein A2585_03200 [Candidatus Nomurabacteria bacterium RIFOXYD1_FULL_39_12]
MNKQLSQNFTNPVVGSSLKGYESGNADAFLEKLIPNGVGLLFVAGSLFFFFQLIWGAVSWVLSGGDKGTLESAKNRLTSAIIGFVLLIASFALIGLIEDFFKINILSIDMGPLFIR